MSGFFARIKKRLVWVNSTRGRLGRLLMPVIFKAARFAAVVAVIYFVAEALQFPSWLRQALAKALNLSIIFMIAWVIAQVVKVGEKLVIERYQFNVQSNLQNRQIVTQVRVLAKMAYIVLSIFTVAAVLMSFEQVRRLGTSILASAGVLGVIVGFAAQRTIANLFAGLQLAFTQPIRLDDVVIVENEWGVIEEITLTYVVVRIWDLRRLVVPITFFLEKPFQNWTRTSANLLGSVSIFVDFTVPVESVRQELRRIVERSSFWDKTVWELQVTNATEHSVELRALVSAADAGAVWNLRCEVREKLIAYLQEKFPASLPRTRAEVDRSVAVPNAWPSDRAAG
jgi:small-conductance mechanosensitive channel